MNRLCIGCVHNAANTSKKQQVKNTTKNGVCFTCCRYWKKPESNEGDNFELKIIDKGE